MSSELNRAERYRDLAEECRHLAATTFSTQMRSRYSRMAEIYTALAEAEEARHTSLRQLAAPVSSQKCHDHRPGAGGRHLAQGVYR
jgi:chromosome segregation ATPase